MILDEAKNLITGSRNKTYGSFSENVVRVQLLMEGMTGRKPSRHEVHSYFLALKLCRSGNVDWTEDTLTDLCGYAALINEDRT